MFLTTLLKALTEKPAATSDAAAVTQPGPVTPPPVPLAPNAGVATNPPGDSGAPATVAGATPGTGQQPVIPGEAVAEMMEYDALVKFVATVPYDTLTLVKRGGESLVDLVNQRWIAGK